MRRTIFALSASWCALAAAAVLTLAGCGQGAMSVEYRGEGDPSDDASPNNTSANNASSNNASSNNASSNNASANNASSNNANTPEAIVPGRVTIRRLNRAEYNNTVRDLFGLDTLSPADTFPADDFGYGFNNNGDVLTVSPLLVELYEKSADSLLEEVLAPLAEPLLESFEAESIGSDVGGANAGLWNLWSNGSITTPIDIATAGEYRFRVRAAGAQAGPDPARLAILVNNAEVHVVDVPNGRADLQVFERTVTLEAGTQLVGVSFVNDYYDPDAGEDRNLYVDWFELEGPLDAPAEVSPQRAAIMICSPEDSSQTECGRQIFANFGRKAWRRPLTDAELDDLSELAFGTVAAHGGEFEDAIKLGLKGILLAPHFIFRPELDRAPAGEPHALSQHELATRLSYFLWSSMPDAELRQLADEGRLDDDATLRAQVERMLADDRATALLDNFAAQWLYTDAVLEVQPDYELFPDFDDALKQSMRAETRRFVEDFLRDDRNLKDLLLADYSYINARLADHYGIPGVEGEELQRVEFEGEGRRGILTHGGLLTARSYPNRTSPVLRGVWVLEQLLCSEPPPPPPGVESIDDGEGGEELTLRERLERHSSDPSCYGCHSTMDPIGFGLEHYDPTGAWRDDDNGRPVDALGELPDGRTFNGAYEMAEILAEDPKFPHCVTEKMMTYALGRHVAGYGDDRPQVEHILANVEAARWSSRELIVQIVLSDAFRMRTPEPAEAEEE